MSQLPTMNAKEALRTHTRHFLSPNKCSHCGTKEKICYGWTLSEVMCVTCYPPETTKKVSLTNLNSAEKKHNEEVARLRRKNWGIPVVFGGMNTA